MKKVLIVDDSLTAREYLSYLIDQDETLEVAGTAKDGVEAVEQVEKLHPDVVLMDIQMPRMDGLEATRQIMTTMPVPIVIISAHLNNDEMDYTFKAMEQGAVCAVEKPKGLGHPDAEKMARKLLMYVSTMAEIKVVRRRSALADAAHPSQDNPAPEGAASKKFKVIAIGASTGGPQALKAILPRLQGNFSLPILVVQHITDGFLEGFVSWLRKETSLPVHVAEQGERPLEGHIYFAPCGYHMTVKTEGIIVLSDAPPEYNVKPAAARLFRSVAQCFGDRAVGILLTGMGKDGAAELKFMRDRDGLTIAQDRESSLVHGMPGEAIKLGAARHIMNPSQIVRFLNGLCSGTGSVINTMETGGKINGN